MTDYSNRVSAAALRSRGLVQTRDRGPTWRAELTAAGHALTRPKPQPEAVSPTAPRLASRARAAPNPERARPRDPIPSELRAAHEAIRQTRSAATGLRAGDDGRLTIGPRSGLIHMRVSRP